MIHIFKGLLSFGHKKIVNFVCLRFAVLDNLPLQNKKAHDYSRAFPLPFCSRC